MSIYSELKERIEKELKNNYDGKLQIIRYPNGKEKYRRRNYKRIYELKAQLQILNEFKEKGEKEIDNVIPSFQHDKIAGVMVPDFSNNEEGFVKKEELKSKLFGGKQ